MGIIRLYGKSIKAKYTIIFTALLLLISTITFYQNYRSQKNESLQFANQHIQTLSEMLAFSAANVWQRGRPGADQPPKPTFT